MKQTPAVFLVAAVLGYSLSAQAHHSFAAMYRAEGSVEIEGQIVQFLFRNPHSFLHIMAPDENGEMTRWTIEWSGASALDVNGLRPDTLKRGDTVIVSGNPGRNPADYRIRMRTLHRPLDGFGWGTRPGEVVD